jgi:hypothetical protein
MSTVFAKLCLRDFLRRRVSAVPPDAADGADIPTSSETTPLVYSSEEGDVWYFVGLVIGITYIRRMARIYPTRRS